MWMGGCEGTDQGLIACGDDTFVDRGARVDLAAEQRNLGIVFQSYAIWPHMTVAQNVAFPLRVRKMGKPVIRARVAEVLALVELGELADRYPHQLSGGHQHRVALARAIAPSPAVLPLDRLFSKLDAQPRVWSRDSLKKLQKQLRHTTAIAT